MAGWDVEWVVEGKVEIAAGEVDASVDGVSDGAELDDVDAWALELLAKSEEDETPESISGIFDSLLG